LLFVLLKIFWVRSAVADGGLGRLPGLFDAISIGAGAAAREALDDAVEDQQGHDAAGHAQANLFTLFQEELFEVEVFHGHLLIARVYVARCRIVDLTLRGESTVNQTLLACRGPTPPGSIARLSGRVVGVPFLPGGVALVERRDAING